MDIVVSRGVFIVEDFFGVEWLEVVEVVGWWSCDDFKIGDFGELDFLNICGCVVVVD